ncbi:MAG TPA: hypothetical protein VNE62_06930 [Actinomycetota bacterium]|nr:hypothetical protein [Actinomycetota bacterium]
MTRRREAVSAIRDTLLWMVAIAAAIISALAAASCLYLILAVATNLNEPDSGVSLLPLAAYLVLTVVVAAVAAAAAWRLARYTLASRRARVAISHGGAAASSRYV